MYSYEKREDKRDRGKVSKTMPCSRSGDRRAIQLRQGRDALRTSEMGGGSMGWRTLACPHRENTQMPVVQRIRDEGIIQRIIPLQQTGANCGMFAMAMALADLMGEERNGMRIAAGLETYAIGHGLSTLGEAFSAIDLALAGKWYCESLGKDDIEFVMAYFATDVEMRQIMEQSREGEVYVLLPYLANKDMNPDKDGEATALPGQMTYAHWSVTEENDGRHRILEGNKMLYGGGSISYLDNVRYGELFKANQRLGDEVEWDGYINNSKRIVRCVQDMGGPDRLDPPRRNIYDRKSIEIDHYEQSSRHGIDIYSVGGRARERVRLNGRAIIVGKREAVTEAIYQIDQLHHPFVHFVV